MLPILEGGRCVCHFVFGLHRLWWQHQFFLLGLRGQNLYPTSLPTPLPQLSNVLTVLTASMSGNRGRGCHVHNRTRSFCPCLKEICPGWSWTRSKRYRHPRGNYRHPRENCWMSLCWAFIPPGVVVWTTGEYVEWNGRLVSWLKFSSSNLPF